MSKKIDLVKDFEAMVNGSPALERVRLDASEIAIIPFTAEAEQVDIHYCKEPDINDYVICNGENCVLCQIGREKTTRRLLPVYLPASRAVGVLPVSTSLRPRSPLAAARRVLKDGSRKAVFISRVQGDSYTVTAVPLQADVEDGAEVIKTFLEDYQKGTIQLDSVYPKVSQRGARRRSPRSPDAQAEGDQGRMTSSSARRLLAAFRAHWNGPRLLDLIAEHGGQALILWPIGVGKSCAIDRIIEAAVGSGRYDLVIATRSPPAVSWRNAPGSEPRRAD